MFEGLRVEVESLAVPVDGDALVEAFGLYDALAARLCEAVARFDGAGLWDVDGATSMTAWLADRVRLPRRRAAGWASRARKLAQLPVMARAYLDGVLSGGQVEAICANLDRETVGLFADHEPEVIPTLAGLSADEVATAMRRWREHATADREPKSERPQELHLSRGLDSQWVLDGSLNPETGDLLETALRLAGTDEVEGDVPRSNATRRADALADLARYFLDHQQTRRGGRHRPHLNVVIDWDTLLANAKVTTAETLSGTVFDQATTLRLLCDAVLHRVIMNGDSAVLDYGNASRTITAPMWAALGVRDRHCRFKGCDRPAAWCEGHHVRPWLYGGPTDLLNLVLLCSRHHHLLHKPGWEAKLLPDATFEVTTPDGRILATRPPGRTPPLPLAACPATGC
jgi:uncharacterized protein DUF222/HNH endonuclease